MLARNRALPITNDEFKNMLRNCRPPGDWSKTIAVANSGGSDSTCLLFLMQQYILGSKLNTQDVSFQKVVSLTVDHDLQSSSSAMAEHCATTANSLGVDHVTSKIPWNTHPYPARPHPDKPFEKNARFARYHLLLRNMRSLGINHIAVGHHADDQVETSLMRLARGSSVLGAGAMRPCRRWGMGDYTAPHTERLGWAGFEGLSKWIVRPLLGVCKDRILATCEANNLDYVSDETNFQPHIGVRNAIRHILNTRIDTSMSEPIPPKILEQLGPIMEATKLLSSNLSNLDTLRDQLQSVVSVFTAKVQDTDRQVDEALKKVCLPSPPATLVLASQRLAEIKDNLICHALILRILRYVSFYGWGGIHADAKRSKVSIARIVENVWTRDPFSSYVYGFSAGGGVMWSPVVIRGGKIKIPNLFSTTRIIDGDEIAWLASRQPPYSHEKRQELCLPDKLHVDVTRSVTEALRKWKEGQGPATLDVMYDCRFLVSLHLSRIPNTVLERLQRQPRDGTLMIRAKTRWFWPTVVFTDDTSPLLIHSKIEKDGLPFPPLDHTLGEFGSLRDVVSVDWITMRWIRPLDAI